MAKLRRGPGRPRSEASHQAIVDAVLELMAEEGSIGHVTIDAVAVRARVSKATIYRRWRDKDALVLDTLAYLAEPIPTPPGRSVRDDLVFLLDQLARRSRRADRRIYAAVIAEGQHNPRVARRYEKIVLEPRREVMRQVLRRGVTRGEVRSGLDLERVHELLVAPVLQYTLLAPPDEAVPSNLPASVVDTVLRGIAGRATRRPGRARGGRAAGRRA